MKANLRRVGTIGLLLSLTFSGLMPDVQATPAPGKATKSASVPQTKVAQNGIEELKLANGLTVLLVKRSMAPVVAVNMIYHVGSRNEAVGYTGSTHFLEHLMFKGTKLHDPLLGTGLDDVLKKVGGINNATTSYDRTNYYEIVPKDSIALALELESDRMRHLLLRKGDRDAEMTVVRNELERGEDEPAELLSNMTFATAFREHPYHHPVIGWRSDVEGVPLARLKQFYNDFYWPQSATLVVIGDFDRTATIALVKKYFDKIPKAPASLPAVYTEEPKQEGERRFVVSRGKELPRVMVAYHTPKGIDKATYPMDVVGTALGDSSRKSTRLYKSLIESGLCSECSASNYTLLDPGLFMVQATVQPGKNPKEVEAVILAEINRVVAEKLTESEIARSKVNIIKHFKLSLSDPMGMAQSLTEGIAVGSWQWWVNYPREIEKVDAKSCQSESAKIFTENNRTVGYYLPSEHSLSEFADYKVADVKLPAVVQEEQPTLVKTAADKATKGSATPGALAPRIRRLTLSNGLTVLLLPASEGNGTVAVSAKIRAGEYFAPAKSRMVADILAKLISYGTKTLNKQALASKLEFMGTSLEMDGGNFFHEFDTEVVKEDLPELIGIIKSCLTEPLLSEADFEEVKQLSIAQIKEESTQTSQLSWNKLLGSLYTDSCVYHALSFEDQIKEVQGLTLDSVKEHHKRYYNPANTVITLVGEFSPEAVEALVKSNFDAWPKASKNSIVLDKSILKQNVPARLDSNLADKANVDIVMAKPVDLSMTAKDYMASLIGNSVLGYDSFACRLAPVRDRYGLTYGIYSRVVDPEYTLSPWAVVLSTNPQNVNKSIKLVNNIVSEFTAKGITPDELAKERSHLAGTFQVGLRSPRALAKKITEYEQLGLPMTNLDNFPERVNKVTLTDVNNAIKRHFDLKGSTMSIAGDLSKIK